MIREAASFLLCLFVVVAFAWAWAQSDGPYPSSVAWESR